MERTVTKIGSQVSCTNTNLPASTGIQHGSSLGPGCIGGAAARHSLMCLLWQSCRPEVFTMPQRVVLPQVSCSSASMRYVCQAVCNTPNKKSIGSVGCMVCNVVMKLLCVQPITITHQPSSPHSLKEKYPMIN